LGAVSTTLDMRNGRCALCDHDEVWQAPIKFSIVEPGEADSGSNGPGLLTTVVCAKCGHLQWFMDNVATWRSAMIASGHPPKRSMTPGSRLTPAAPEPVLPRSRVPKLEPIEEEVQALCDVHLVSAEDVESEVAHTLESLGIPSSKAYSLAFATPALVAQAIPQLQAERFRIALLASGAVATIEPATALIPEAQASASATESAEIQASGAGSAEIRPSTPENKRPSRTSQPAPSLPVCRGCGKPMAHHQIMITQKGQLCAECYHDFEAQGSS